MGRKRTILAVPDLHVPAHHPDALRFLRQLKRDLQPDVTVFLGDEIDAQSVSRYSPDPDQPSPGFELRRAAEELTPFFRLFPQALVCRSNHTDRLYKRAFAAGLPAAALRPVNELLGAPAGWCWADFWEIDGIRFTHGDGFSGDQIALKAARQFRRPVVLGHLHTQGGVQYDATDGSTVWGLSAGCLIDESQP